MKRLRDRSDQRKDRPTHRQTDMTFFRCAKAHKKLDKEPGLISSFFHLLLEKKSTSITYDCDCFHFLVNELESGAKNEEKKIDGEKRIHVPILALSKSKKKTINAQTRKQNV